MTDIQCASMRSSTCTKEVTHIDVKGFIYCIGCAHIRKFNVRVRKLTKSEIKTLVSGNPLKKY